MNERGNDDVCLAHSSDRIRRVCQQIEMKMIAQSCEKSKDRDDQREPHSHGHLSCLHHHVHLIYN